MNALSCSRCGGADPVLDPVYTTGDTFVIHARCLCGWAWSLIAPPNLAADLLRRIADDPAVPVRPLLPAP